MDEKDVDAELHWIGERRLVTRYAVPDVPLTLTYARRGVFRARSTASLCAVLADISAIGAQIVAPHSMHLLVRSSVELELAGDTGRGVVRDVRPIGDGDARYGVEFVDMSDRFRDRILALTERASAQRA